MHLTLVYGMAALHAIAVQDRKARTQAKEARVVCCIRTICTQYSGWKGVEVSIMRSVINESQAQANFLHFKFHLCYSPNPFNIIDRFKSMPIFSVCICAFTENERNTDGSQMKTKYAATHTHSGAVVVWANGIQFRKLIKIC